MYKFVFVILNFNTTEETKNCITSIQNLSYVNKEIVVVDNASPNQKEFLDEIKAYTAKLDNVHILKSTVNTGYAKGNNIGIYFARTKLNADFICVINPDVILINNDFVEQFINVYKTKEYSVGGPQILQDGYYINPLGGYHERASYFVKRSIIDFKIAIIKKHNLGRFNFIRKYKNKEPFIKKVKEQTLNISPFILKKKDNAQLSGACLIFTPKFFEDFSGFSNKTFLYGEEIIIAIVCYNCERKLLLNTQSLVMHGGEQSSKSIFKADDEMKFYKYKTSAKSGIEIAKILLNKKNKRKLKAYLNPIVDSFEIVK